MSIKMKKSLFFPITLVFSLFLFDSCIKINPSCPPPTKFDRSVTVSSWDGDPNVVGTQIVPNIPFNITVQNCSNGQQTASRTFELITGQNGTNSTSVALEEEVPCGEKFPCKPIVTVLLGRLPPNLIAWGGLVSSSKLNEPLRITVAIKPKTILQLQLKSDTAYVNQLNISTSQFDGFGRVSHSNDHPAGRINGTLFLDVAKGVNTYIRYQTGIRLIRIDTIKASQLDTLVYSAKL